ncbi:Alpha/beta hydrolase fold-3 domain protein [Hymenobacter roseosalivarius DSM 11622]|uniref:Alpha/beta hydrolase fold-3 domain protein n=1 Tax=Hymenobacter roseosalivarius DSM 11622 TaxID=645990 RepID=A0A1W1VLT5_9BACT|nr:alpha/beta hydrolase [Hymenobacter roseosalivarius]SMB94317.1 Alpha/beta hydrolase fold-3 domain protein [Hymenobacter roseosalivarius DSM 11622]
MPFFRLLALPALLVLLILIVGANEYAVARPSRRTQDIAYVSATDPGFSTERHRLDVYAPRRKAVAGQPVVVFIHGGNWDSGSKNIYTFIGRRLAKQGVVAVVINYRLSPQVQVPAMAEDCARAVGWTRQHIAEYGGDPQHIFLMGHSAGAGLAALLATDNRYFTWLGLSQNPVRGVILDDPAGLDMYDYLLKKQYASDEQYLTAFGRDPEGWKAVSALYHLTAASPPFLTFVGGKTYPSIASSSEKFRQRLLALGIQPQFTVLPDKKHIPMVLQLYWQHNVIYRQLLPFVGSTSQADRKKSVSKLPPDLRNK